MKRPVKLPVRRSRFVDRRQISSERARPLNQPGAVRANGFVSLIVKPLTSGGPSHFYARSAWHVIAPAHDTIRRRRRALYGTALNSGHVSSSR
jgi:hypothetical protein